MKGKNSYGLYVGALFYLLMVLAVSQLPASHPNLAPKPDHWPGESTNPLVGNWQGSWGGELAAMVKRNIDIRLVVYPGETPSSIAKETFLSLAPNPNLRRPPSQLLAETNVVNDGSSLTFFDGTGSQYRFDLSDERLIGHYTSTTGDESIVTLYRATKADSQITGDSGTVRFSLGPLIVDDFSLYMMYLVLWDSAMQSVMYFLGCAIGFIIFYRMFNKYFEKRKIQTRKPNWRQYKYEIGYSITAMLIFGWGGCILYYGMYADYVQLFTEPDAYGWPYYFLSIALIFILHDTYFYWGHRAMHIRKLYPYFHKGHHRSPSPTPWASWAFPPLEGLVQAAFVPIVIAILPMHFSVLIIFFIGNLVRSIIGHCGYEIYPRATVTNKWFSWIATVTHHDMHHQHFNYNYAIYFTWWDRLMGTEHPEYVDRVKAVLDRK